MGRYQVTLNHLTYYLVSIHYTLLFTADVCGKTIRFVNSSRYVTEHYHLRTVKHSDQRYTHTSISWYNLHIGLWILHTQTHTHTHTHTYTHTHTHTHTSTLTSPLP